MPIAATVLLVILLLSSSVFPQQRLFPEATSWVNDYAGLLTPGQRQILDDRLETLQKNTSTQIFVGIFRKIPPGYVLEDYVVKLFEKWQPGRQQEDNGILLAIFLEDRKLRIEVGYGLEDVLTDAQAITVIDDYITPQFRKDNYFQGIFDGLQIIISAVEGRYQIPEKHSDDDNSFWLFIIAVIIVLIVNNMFTNYSTTYTGRGYKRHPWDGPIIWGGGGNWGGGSGGSGGGFSGGFGGSSGGGGASGGW